MENCGSIREWKLDEIYFYLTEGCNLRCCHCWIAPRHESGNPEAGFIDVGLFKHILDQGRPLGLGQVKLTGGEPLLHPHVAEIISTVHEEGLRLGIETNGVLCTEEIAALLAHGKEPAVSVSLDGAEAATHDRIRGVKGCFNAALEGIRNLVSVGIKPQIIFSIMNANRHQAEEIVRLAESEGAGSVKFNIIQPSGRGAKLRQSGMLPEIADLVDLGHQVQEEMAGRAGIPLFYDIPAAFRSLKGAFSPEGACMTCGISGIIGVLPNGAYALCGIGEVVPELVFGNADRDELKDVWNNTPILKEIRAGLPDRLEGICRRCIMKKLCLGNCLAQNWAASHSLWGAHWFCREAYETGIFPKTRLLD